MDFAGVFMSFLRRLSLQRLEPLGQLQGFGRCKRLALHVFAPLGFQELQGAIQAVDHAVGDFIQPEKLLGLDAPGPGMIWPNPDGADDCPVLYWISGR